MVKIDYLPGTSQVVLFVFDFRTGIMHVFITYHNRLVEAVAYGKPFDSLEVFPVLENELDPGRDFRDLVLDCELSVDLGLRMEILPGLLELMPKVDPSSIKFTVKGRVKNPLERIRWGGIEFILVYALLQDDCWPVIKDDKYYVRVPCGSDPRALPEDYSPHGVITPGVEPAFIPGRKKGHLTVVKAVPKPGRKRGKGARPPKDLMKYGRKMGLRESWEAVVVQLYNRSDARWLRDVPHYPRATKRRGRYYFCGISYLARMSGVAERTVVSVLGDLVEAKLVYIRYHGYKGRGCSIIELPPNMKLVMKWRREHES